MKKFILLFICIQINTFQAQIKNGNVMYSKILNVDFNSPRLSENKELSDKIKESQKNSEKIEYALNFNLDEAYFYAIPILIENINDFNLSAISGNGKIKYYQNEKKNEYRQLNDFPQIGSFIVENKVRYDWTLINETKTIDGYKCYKATSPLFRNGTGEQMGEKFNLTAWYCPEIPVKFGPTGYGGLPGLILELKFYGSIFFAKKINLNPTKKIEINKLDDKKSISFQQYEDILTSNMSKEDLQRKKDFESKQKEAKK